MAEKLVQKRGRVKGTVTRLKTYADSIDQYTLIEDIITRLEKLNEAWNEFIEIEDNLLLFDNQTSELEEFEKRFYETKSIFKRAIEARVSRSSQEGATAVDQFNSTMNQFLSQQQSLFQTFDRSQGNLNTTRLPKLNVPCFSGEYKEWPSFKDLYEASVHSKDYLTPSQKFQHLKGLLKGSAAGIVRHLTISDANYEEAWAKLKKRFDKKAHIATSFIKTFLDQTSINQATVKSLRSLHDTFDETIRGLKGLGTSAEARDPWIIYLALTKLDSDTREQWSQLVADKEFPSFTEFLEFLNTRCNALEACGVISKRTSSVKAFHATSKQLICPKCNADHNLHQCERFKADSPTTRKALVVARSLCFKCLGANHSIKRCYSKIRCHNCKGNHHPLLHIHQESNKAASPTLHPCSQNRSSNISSINQTTFHQESSINPLSQTQSSINPVHSADASTNPSTANSLLSSLNKCIQEVISVQANDTPVDAMISVLPTAVVNVLDIHGRVQPCRVLLDSGSQVSLISEACAQRLALKRENARIIISGLSASAAGSTKGKISLNLSSRWDKSKVLEIVAFVMSKLTSVIPSETLTVPDWTLVKSLQLADPGFDKPSHIDIILGADHFFEVLCEKRLYTEVGYPIAQDTIFGWVLSGNVAERRSKHSAINLHSGISTDLDQMLQRFWETEEITSKRTESEWNEEEKRCSSHFNQNTSRDITTGRFVVSLPFKKSTCLLGESKGNATARLYAMERRFLKDANFKKEYTTFMREYEALNHMELIPENEDNTGKCFYMPHHAVYKNSPVPRIRVVFDGSCRTSSGISLNETLMVGPTLQRDLLAILMSFRKHKIGLSADIEKMYRQILVNSDDQDYQRILWRENSYLPLKHFKLKTVTYGTASASFLATRALHQIGEEHKTTNPRVADIIQNDFYVDDLLTGAESVSEATKLQEELLQILGAYGFNLTKWKTNSLTISGNVEKGCRAIDDNSGITKVLGIQWNPNEDAFSFTMSPMKSLDITKRIILSESSKIFDPMGWLAPAVITIKILFQQLWLLSCSWDDPVPQHVLEKWQTLQTQLPALTEIKIPRCIYDSQTSMQLHGFADASEAAYAAVVYCRSLNSENQPVVRIIASKTKVAPLKQISLPRLELCGALLLTNLMSKVLKSLQLEDVTTFAWTDSTVVLAWLSDTPRKWKTFVANRVAEILDVIPRSQWKHVPSKENPADIASRGTAPKELPTLDIWWHGPAWLSEDPSNWPSIDPTNNKSDNYQEEMRKNIISHFQKIADDTFSEILNRFSSFSKLTRVLAYCLRFCNNCKEKSESNRQLEQLSAHEINNATTLCIKFIQKFAFKGEIEELTSNNAITKNSRITNLTPFLDESGILRVGGRIQNSARSFSSKHPIIMPKDHHVTELLVSEAHKLNLHPGASLLTAIIRQRYWIIGIRDVVNRICRKCIICFKQRATRTSQLMGNLPKARVIASRPFSKVGVDYAGPLTLCTKTGRGAKHFKGYIALFICMATKAMHLEVVSSLTSEAFVATLRRFVSRRGIPSDIFCDNGTNFVGAKKYINEMHNLALSSTRDPLIAHFLSQHRISWNFNPPGAPHFGGLWEAGVKSVKWHLKRVIGETVLTLEEMTTLLTQIEAVLNSRPYAELSSNPEEYDALTPSHFLIGEPLTALPEADVTELKTSRLGRWQHLQQMVQGFWKRWHHEYLSAIQERPKWRREYNSLKEGELVIVGEDNLPPSRWLLARIVATHPGNDGLVRVVTVRSQRGTFKRAINKIFKLPVC